MIVSPYTLTNLGTKDTDLFRCLRAFPSSNFFKICLSGLKLDCNVLVFVFILLIQPIFSFHVYSFSFFIHVYNENDFMNLNFEVGFGISL